MSGLCFGLIALLIATAFPHASQAQSDREGGRHLLNNKYGEFAPFRGKSASELMSKSEYQDYTRALVVLDCANANQILNSAFARQYPTFVDARLGPHCPHAPNCNHWAEYSRLVFKAYGHCRTIVDFMKLEKEIRDRGYPQQKYKLPPPWKSRKSAAPAYKNQWMLSRDLSLSLLIISAQSDYQPALFKLAELVRRGDLFNAGNDVEYYILKRACIVGSACQELKPRINKLRADIGTKRADNIDEKTNANDGSRPDLNELLLGGVL